MSDSTAGTAPAPSENGQEANRASAFRLVGIGASAGGLEALKAFFDNVPEACPHSFIIIQHLSPDYKTMMAELLARNTRLPIHEVINGMVIEPGSIYLITPNTIITLDGRALIVRDRPEGQALTLPIDIFFQSLAAEEGENAIAVILSGTGSDGTRGARAVKEAGGTVMVQSPEQAKFDGMPMSVLRTGLADFISPVEILPKEILQFIDFPGGAVVWDTEADEEDKSFQRIISHIYHTRELDFSQYKRPTLARRIERRMSITKSANLQAYLQHIYQHPDEIDVLCREFLIGVTKFFRDTEIWNVFEAKVVPALVEASGDGKSTPIRVWVVGCSTGEEVYTIAILLREAMKRQRMHREVKIFATDLQAGSLDIARKAVYPESIVADVTPERLAEYFVRQGDEYEVVESIRKMVIFSQHDILRDPPFRSIDLVTCRNVLIYLNPEAQRRVVGMLHYALDIGGTLMLGPSETLHDYDTVFDVVDRRARLYRNTQMVRSLNLAPLSYPDTIREDREAPPRGATSNPLPEIVSEAVMEEWGMAGFYVNADFDILEATGEVSRFIVLPERGFTINLLKLLPSQVGAMLGVSIRKAQKQQERVLCKQVRMQETEGTLVFNILVCPAGGGALGRNARFLLLFIPQEVQVGIATVTASDLSDADALRMKEMEHELKTTRESLQAAIEELETTNEELQATNEELLAANEELQSTNEELQSLNEELLTVNSEYQQKIEDLAALNADMDNLLKSTEIGTVFLDEEMCIRKLTPAIRAQFNLRTTDIGRPIAHFTSNFGERDSQEILDRAKEVMRSTQAHQFEVADDDDNWYLVKITPFRNSEGRVDGVVISFVNINELKEVQAQLMENNEELKQFAYITSHDLQEPLRTITSFSTRFQTDYIHLLDERGLKYLQFMGQSAERMSDLLVGLLGFSRIGRYGQETAISISKVIQSVMADLSAQIQRTDAEIAITTTLPRVRGYKTELHSLFLNLISNALKFHRDGVLPRVEISVETTSEERIFAIADNGIGIAPEHQERIFLIFQRLHTSREYEGTGIGLANCRKIVELHGGRIWVESEVGTGSTFYFSIPTNVAAS
ncbi:MAG: chemotaxis protein CheB [Bacteroidota bacterium]